MSIPDMAGDGRVLTEPCFFKDPCFFKEVLDHVSDGVYFVDLERRIFYWNESAFRLTGYGAQEMLGQSCDEFLCHVDAAGKRLCQDGCPLTASLRDGGMHETQVFLRHKQGRRIPVAVRVLPIRAADNSIVGAVEIFSDETAHHAARREAEQLERLAFLDQLTHLPNRRYLEMSLRTALREYHVHKDGFGLLVIDLDRFKAINDGFGHATGDRALRQVAKTLVGALRTTDIVGRWGGDEFLAVVRHVDAEILKTLAERCCVLVAQTSFRNGDGRGLSTSVSIGGSLVTPKDTFETLTRRADDLMYQSKAGGRSRASLK
ncbi:MAG: sensor domain-containing diguanylate cyclase [Terriglobales bacterium]